VDWVSGACMLVRKEAIEETGLMDEKFFMYWEDADWCKRMRDNGWKIIYYPQASIYHHIGKSSNKRPFPSIYHFHRSSYLLHEKYTNFPLSLLNPLVLILLTFRGIIIAFITIVKRYKTRPHLPKGSAVFRIKKIGGVHKISKKEKIKILRIISRLNIGGPAIHVNLLHGGINSDWFESTLVSGSISPREGDMIYLYNSSDNLPVCIPELQREVDIFDDIKSLFKLMKIINQEKPSIVHSHTSKAGSLSRMAVLIYNLLFRRKIRTIHTFHGHVFEGYFNKFISKLVVWAERILAIFTDKIIALSQIQSRELIEKHRIANEKKIEIIKLGFDLGPLILCQNNKGQFRKQLDLDSETFLVGIIGRLVPIKNHYMFIKAAKLFIKQYPEINIKFIIIGDGELRQKLMYACNGLGLLKNIQFCGWIKDIATVYADLDVAVLTSNNEGTPVSIIESMAASVPVISTDVGGIKDLLGPFSQMHSINTFQLRERGICLEKDDAQGMANAIKFLIDNKNDVRHHITSAAKKYVIDNYNKNRLIQEIESLYLKLMNQ
jgi:glycosyltransferase involved in cell wall biosynthesis